MIEKDHIYLGDCLELMREIPDKSIDAVICDLPFATTRNSWDILIPFAPLWEQYKRITTDNAPIVLFAQQPFASELVMSNPNMFRYEWIWEKDNSTGFLNAKIAPLKVHENILVFSKRKSFYNPQMTQGKPYYAKRGTKSSNYGKQQESTVTINNGERYPIDVIKFNTERHGLHPTAKPIPLLQYLIRTYSPTGGGGS